MPRGCDSYVVRETPEVPHVSVRDLDLYYELHGSGPPLLVISGTGNDLRSSRPDRWPLNADFTCLHFDQRFLGQTGGPDAPAAMAEFGDDAAALLDAMGWNRAHVIGTSFGGMVAQHLALRHPDRVDRLVLACTSSGGAGGSSADLLGMADLDEAERGIRSLELLDLRADPRNGVLPPGLDEYIAAFAAPAAPPDPAAVALARRQLEARDAHDTFEQLARIGAPTLVIGGVHDGLAPVSNLEILAERIPDARLVLCDGGHLFMLQDPSAFPQIREFLRA